MNKLSSRLGEAAEQVFAALDELETKIGSIKQHDVENQLLLRRLEKLKTERDKLRDEVEALRDQNADMRSEIKTLRSANKDVANRLDSAIDSVKSVLKAP